MAKRWMMGAAAVALTVATAVAAQAADLPTKKAPVEPVYVPPPFTWTGFYVGVNAGAIWKQGNNSNNTLFAPNFPALYAYWPNGGGGNGNTGFLGGGQAGYNFQYGAAVFGIETDFDGSSLSKSTSVIGPSFLSPVNGVNDFFTANGKISLDWLGTTRLRVGFVATPDNRLMFYGTGGVAYGGGTAHLNVYDAANGIYFSSGNHNSTRTGWTLGAGVEYALTNNIILGAEYLYYNLGSKTVTTAPLNYLAGVNNVYNGVYASSKVNFDGSAVRARISYKF